MASPLRFTHRYGRLPLRDATTDRRVFFNPYHGEDGKFTTAGGGGTGEHAGPTHAGARPGGYASREHLRPEAAPTVSSPEATRYASPAQREAVHNAAHEIVAHASQEHAVVVKPDGAVFFTGTGEGDHIGFELKDYGRWVGMDLVHNHTGVVDGQRLARSLSVDDAQRAMEWRLGGMHAVGKAANGHTILYTLRPAAGTQWTWRTWKALEPEVARTLSHNRTILQHMHERGEITKAGASEVIMHRVWLQLAHHHPDKLSYTWEVRP